MFGTNFYETLDFAGSATMSAKEIYNYLDERVIKQDEAKKAAAMLMWKSLNGIKQNVMFCGPTGCGKTEIWRCLSKLFPDRISIVDVSSITQEGIVGRTKWCDLFGAECFKERKNAVMVLDEIDKLITPDCVEGDNVSEHLMNEGLKLIEGTVAKVSKQNERDRYVDTNLISFAMLGAFSRKAEENAEKEKTSGIGFCSEKKKPSLYSKPITLKDILDFGATPEFMGRVNKIVNLSPMTKEDYEGILYKEKCSPIKKLEDTYKIKIYLSEENKERILEDAVTNGLGIRGIANELSSLLDDRLFEDPSGKCVLI